MIATEELETRLRVLGERDGCERVHCAGAVRRACDTTERNDTCDDENSL